MVGKPAGDHKWNAGKWSSESRTGFQPVVVVRAGEVFVICPLGTGWKPALLCASTFNYTRKACVTFLLVHYEKRISDLGNNLNGAVRVKLNTHDKIGKPATSTDARSNMRTLLYNAEGKMSDFHYTTQAKSGVRSGGRSGGQYAKIDKFHHSPPSVCQDSHTDPDFHCPADCPR